VCLVTDCSVCLVTDYSVCLVNYLLFELPTVLLEYLDLLQKEDALLPAMFNPLFSSTNQQLLKRTFVATTDDLHNKWKPSHVIETSW